MDIKLYNTLSRQKESFKPIIDGRVGIYTCGPTVYSRASIGNFRSYLFSDLLRRMFELNGFLVKQVINITDVGHLTSDASEGEDKLEKASKATGETAWDIAKKYTELFLQDMERLNILRPHELPRATDHIEGQIELVKVLDKKGFTYQTSDGIYFDTSRLADYGKLAGQKLEDKQEGARVEVNEEKKNPTDFALWKFSPKDAKRQMEWESPWGIGFPGWHIECSAMSEEYLGVPFDIHTGGIDHIPVHHTNEIAQTESAREKPLANVWMHNAFLLVDNGKMSKSLGNTYSLDDLQARGFDSIAYRYFFFGAHYRVQQNFTWEALEASQNALHKLQKIVKGLPKGADVNEEYKSRFMERINDDLDVPGALSVLWTMIKDDNVAPELKYATLIKFDEVLGLGLSNLELGDVEVPEEVHELLDLRAKARAEKNWELSDQIRDKILELGFEISDGQGGQTIEPIV
ncbi:cysteine--tRNA ligase [Patescibacteria group bacterium]|nr:cysteine--tRNA ligase [Patescibacteria group bacterium]MBU4452920.1 cysteine--tRNA ligase [Patescibacteria group bacterium]